MTFSRSSESSLGRAVAANIRAEAARGGITGQELATRIGVSAWFMSRRLRGEVAITVDELDAIARALDVPAETLLARSKAAAA